MTFKTRAGISKEFDTIFDFGIKNLVVSGCSFTYNNHDTAAVTWPYCLRDLGGFEQVFDTSMPGVGNYHIANSLIWSLELEPMDTRDSLVIVMWSGNDRDDYITPSSNINHYPFEYRYTADVMSAMAGAANTRARGNTKRSAREFFAVKTPESKAVENYLYIAQTWNYLQNQGYRTVFLNYLDPAIPSRTSHFDIRPYLPARLQKNLDHMMSDIQDPYSFSIRRDLLWDDDLHPSPDGHLSWTREVLVPQLKQILK